MSKPISMYKPIVIIGFAHYSYPDIIPERSHIKTLMETSLENLEKAKLSISKLPPKALPIFIAEPSSDTLESIFSQALFPRDLN